MLQILGQFWQFMQVILMYFHFSRKCRGNAGKCSRFPGKCSFFSGKCSHFSGRCMCFLGILVASYTLTRSLPTLTKKNNYN